MSDWKNQLYYGDNLDVLRRYIADESVDLVYLDPPFNSRQDYNVLFAEKDGSRSSSQIRAFEDTWEWNIDAEAAYLEVVETGGRVADAMRAFRTFLGGSDMMAYLAMMAPRLIELRRVMKPTASIYLHCDPTASHYLKLLMDGIFGPQNFRNEIIWRRTTTKNDYVQGATNWPRVHDVLLTFSKDATSDRFDQPFAPLDDEYVRSHYHLADEAGRKYQLTDLTAPGSGMRGHPQYEFMGVTKYWRYNQKKMEGLLSEGRIIQPRPGAVPRYKRYLDEMKGTAIGDIWADIPPINSQAQERLGYPTQKPEALLERILKASSNEGDLVLDPFCGCGTTVQVAQRLYRRWIGIDITHLAIGLIKKRLADSFGDEVSDTYRVVGEPTDLEGARELANEPDRYQFQSWALGLCGARPIDNLKKGADRGIDGRLLFHDEKPLKTKQILFSVKSGHVTVNQVRDLRGTLEREKAEIGAFLCIEEPTKPMYREAAEAGFYTSGTGEDRSEYPRIQILTIEGLMNGTERLQYPRLLESTFKRAPKARPSAPKNLDLELN